jgi:hypothetical protein
MTDLGVLEGQSSSAAWFISSKGQIVGHSHDCVSASRPECEDAVLWENGGPPINLNTRVANGSALHTLDAYYINDRGEIAGYGVLPGCAPQDFETCGHVYVLIPCGEADEGCETGTEGAAAATQNLAPINDATTTSRQPRSTPSGAAAAWRARLAQRYYIPGLRTPKD